MIFMIFVHTVCNLTDDSWNDINKTSHLDIVSSVGRSWHVFLRILLVKLTLVMSEWHIVCVGVLVSALRKHIRVLSRWYLCVTPWSISESSQPISRMNDEEHVICNWTKKGKRKQTFPFSTGIFPKTIRLVRFDGGSHLPSTNIPISIQLHSPCCFYLRAVFMMSDQLSFQQIPWFEQFRFPISNPNRQCHDARNRVCRDDSFAA